MSFRAQQHALWHYLLTHYKEKKTLVEGPLNNLQPSMIQFSKPRRPFDRNANTNRFQHDARDVFASGLNSGSSTPGLPSRFDSSFYRTHDAISSIPSDAQSVRSQATYSSGLPTFSQAGSAYPSSMKRGGPASTYASSTFSQDLLSSADGASVRGDDASSIANGGVPGSGMSSAASSVGYSQADRISLSDAVSDYKSQAGWTNDDDARTTYTLSNVTDC
jgi:regulator of nonsense transcripts 1